MRIANLNAYKLKLDARGSAAWQARVTAVHEIGPHILGLQEVVVDESATATEEWDESAAETIKAFAADCGLTASVEATPGYPYGAAMAANSHRPWYTALLWDPNAAEVVPGSYRPYGAPDFWHGFTTARFDIGACEPVTVGSYHGDPFRPDFRANEALRVKGIYRRTGGAKPGFVIGDFNAPSAATVTESGVQRYYDAEPYLDQDHDDLEFQMIPDTIGGEQLADRRQTHALLRRGFLVDAAVHLRVPSHPTVGHWEDGRGDPDPWGPRRIDLILATRPAAPALVRYGVHRSTAAEAGSDHLPLWVDVDPSKISREFTIAEGPTGRNSQGDAVGGQG
ncbi:endonuclease/exonuclease/phosphatase family protein [Streptomyces lydicus]|uniref:endonuclease/exonuclease/phosphatase family protein n=1 Tax=Streptomyces lydicus TaxID=47763 RepID=UPI0036EF68E1